MGQIKIFDTLTAKEKNLEFQDKVRIYLCGVTVYDDSHIGHARTIVIFDTLRRFLECKDIKVELIQNFTDVDDKIIKKANESGETAQNITSKYIERYFEEFDQLNIKRADEHPKATDHIQDMINLISDLVKKDLAYVVKNGVYFKVLKFSNYGKLSKKKIDDLESGARVEIDKSKNDPLDFALWKSSTDSPNWDSPWGTGRPGWHIECSAMSIKYLGENFEIHGGGRDLIFPHHENEIAQSESFTQKPFAKIWMHAGMITINGEKMSKSLGNVKTLRHVLDNWGPNIIRLFCLSGHYSKPIDYTEDLLKENLIKWRQLETCYYELRLAHVEGSSNATEIALAAEEKITKNDVDTVMPILEEMLSVLGLSITKTTDEEIKSIFDLLEQREEFRKNKQFDKADKIREQVSDKGIYLIDHKTKTLWLKKEKINAEK